MSPKLQSLPTSRTLGWMLQSVRKSKGLTQAHLASRVGVGQSRISHLEQHPDELSVQQLLAWCSALNLELSLGPKGTSDSGAPDTGSSKAAW